MAQSKQLESILGRSIPATARPVPATVAAPQPEPKEPAGQGAPLTVIESKPAPKAAAKVVSKPKAEKPQAEPAAAEPQKSIQAYVPASLVRQLNIKAAEEGTTVRTIILQGLKALGMPVADEELRDRRK